MPPAITVHGHGHVAYHATQGAGPAEPGPAELRQPHRSPFPVQLGRAHSLARERHRHPRATFFAFRRPGRVAGVPPDGWYTENPRHDRLAHVARLIVQTV